MGATIVQTQFLRRGGRWVVADEAFGGHPGFLEGMAGLGLWYLAEMPHRTRVWETRPATHVPPWRGRAATRSGCLWCQELQRHGRWWR
jgi:DDE superfamily endonuclease